MKKMIIVLISVFGVCCYTSGQVTEVETNLRKQRNDTLDGWRNGGVFSINLSQTSLTNWAAGGENSVAVNGLFSVFANYKKGKSSWDNSLDIGYGLMKQGDDSIWIKTDDKVDLLSKYGRQASKHWYYAGLVNFKTQTRPGYKYPDITNRISDFMAPAYLLGALGMDYKPKEYLSGFVAPLTSKVTIVKDQTLADAGAFGVEKAVLDATGNVITPGQNIRKEFGGYLRMIYSRNDFKPELLQGITFTTKIDLFSNYLEKPQNIDVSWETLISLKVNKFISVNITTHLLYDDDVMIQVDTTGDGVPDKVGPRTQFKEILGVGFSYKF